MLALPFTNLRIYVRLLFLFSIFSITFFSFFCVSNIYAAEAMINLSQGKKIVSSSQEEATLLADHLLDGNLNTRWSSEFNNDQWFMIDLDAQAQVETISFYWQNSYATAYQVYVSLDGQSWKMVYLQQSGHGGIETISLGVPARFVKWQGISRYTRYGYSLFEVTVNGHWLSTPIAPEPPPEIELPTSPLQLSLGARAFASSFEDSGLTASLAIDDNLNTRWSSNFADNQWLALDLKQLSHITEVVLHWQNSFATEYLLQTSFDGEHWQTVFHKTLSVGGIERISLNNAGQFIRILGLKRQTRYGISLWEFEVYGQPLIEKSLPISHVLTSSDEDASLTGNFAIDGDSKTRWSSQFANNQWIEVDLGQVQYLKKLSLHWQNSRAVHYQVEVSDDGNAWRQVFEDTQGQGEFDEIPLVTSARYLRVRCITRLTRYGFSLWELSLIGAVLPNAGGEDTPPPPINPPTGGDDQGGVGPEPIDPPPGGIITPPPVITPPKGFAILKWQSPLERENGSPLLWDDIAGYELQLIDLNGAVYQSILLNQPELDQYRLSEAQSSYFYRLAIFDTNGFYSEFITIEPTWIDTL